MTKLTRREWYRLVAAGMFASVMDRRVWSQESRIAGVLIGVQSYSFRDRDLQGVIDGMVATGLTTSGCVRASVVDGLQHDYPVFVPRQAVGDRNPNAHEANLFDLQQKYADVMSLREVKEELAKLTPGQSDVAPDAPAE